MDFDSEMEDKRITFFIFIMALMPFPRGTLSVSNGLFRICGLFFKIQKNMFRVRWLAIDLDGYVTPLVQCAEDERLLENSW